MVLGMTPLRPGEAQALTASPDVSAPPQGVRGPESSGGPRPRGTPCPLQVVREAPLSRPGYGCSPERSHLAPSPSRPAPPRGSLARCGGGLVRGGRALTLAGTFATCPLAPLGSLLTHPPHSVATVRVSARGGTRRAEAQGRRGAPRCPRPHTRAPRPASGRWPPRGRSGGARAAGSPGRLPVCGAPGPSSPVGRPHLPKPLHPSCPDLESSWSRVPALRSTPLAPPAPQL